MNIQHSTRVPFGVMLLIKMGAVLFLIFTNGFVFIVLYLSFSLRYLVELKLLQSLNNEATWAQIWVISS